MKLLEPFVNHYIECPFYKEEKILRSGVPMNGSCFFYSLYYGLKTFRDLNDEEKLNYIREKRARLSEELTTEGWLELQNGSIALLQFSSTLRIMIYTMTFLLESEKEVEILQNHGINIEHLKILNELLNITVMDKKLFPRFDMECIRPQNLENDNTLLYHYLKSTFVNIYRGIIEEEIELLEMNVNVPKWTLEKKEKIINTLTNVSNGIFSYVCERAIKDFKEEIKNVEIWLNIYQFYYILNSTQSHMNIFIIDANTMLPYIGLDMSYDESLPCVVILYFSDHHFESIGIEKKKSKKIYRTLPFDDPFIQSIIHYLEEQQNIFQTEADVEEEKSIKDETIEDESVTESQSSDHDSIKSQHERLSNMVDNESRAEVSISQTIST